MIGPVTGWFEIAQYDDKIPISISNLVKNTCLYRYPGPIEITHGQVSEFIGHDFRKYLIEDEYRITPKTRTLVNPMSNVVLEWIHQVLGNLVWTFIIYQTYIDKMTRGQVFYLQQRLQFTQQPIF